MSAISLQLKSLKIRFMLIKMNLLKMLNIEMYLATLKHMFNFGFTSNYLMDLVNLKSVMETINQKLNYNCI